mmetsp:Transcript_13392/g.21246  ORF Transcript_13392/g.21246 Transcript_13392/m.21246 type:complete len:156 (-) Transcript_13392:321-788(-)
MGRPAAAYTALALASCFVASVSAFAGAHDVASLVGNNLAIANRACSAQNFRCSQKFCMVAGSDDYLHSLQAGEQSPAEVNSFLVMRAFLTSWYPLGIQKTRILVPGGYSLVKNHFYPNGYMVPTVEVFSVPNGRSLVRNDFYPNENSKYMVATDK